MEEREAVDPGRIAGRLEALPGLPALRQALAGERAYLVGGAVRDLLLGLSHPDLDVAVEGDVAAVAKRLGAETVTHERFGTATVSLDGTRVDLARTRRERYERPGALPEVEPAPLAEDLARRDFTVNAMAVPLAERLELIDPHGGVEDLRAGLLRVLHEGSFRDDPTRALRAARYAARLDFALEPDTAALLADADLASVSRERVAGELRRIALEPEPAPAFALLEEWQLGVVKPGAAERVRAVLAVLADPAWRRLVDRAEAVVHAAVLDPRLEIAAERLGSSRPARPSEGVALARGRAPLELLAGRAAGATWLDDYVADWRDVRLEIDGEDLLAAGVPEGRAVGRGLAAALAAKLDGDAPDRDAQLRIALEAARP